MRKLLFLALGAMFLVVSAVIAFTSDHGEVYFALPLCLGLLFAGVAVVMASKEQSIPLPQPKKYKARNLFDDEVEVVDDDFGSSNGQSLVVYAFYFFESGAVVFWVLGMIFFFKMTAFVTVVVVVALVVRSCSSSTLKDARIKLEQSVEGDPPRLSS